MEAGVRARRPQGKRPATRQRPGPDLVIELATAPGSSDAIIDYLVELLDERDARRKG